VAYVTAFQHASARLTELLSNSKAISSINQSGFLNLHLDYQCLLRFAETLPEPMTQCLGELQQLLALFLESESVKEILDDAIYRAKYAKVNLKKLVSLLDKYKNDKTVLEAGKSTGNAELDAVMRRMKIVRKSECEEVAKKLKTQL